MSSTVCSTIFVILIITLSVKIEVKICLALPKIKNEKEFRSQSIKTQCIVFGLYKALHEIESAI